MMNGFVQIERWASPFKIFSVIYNQNETSTHLTIVTLVYFSLSIIQVILIVKSLKTYKQAVSKIKSTNFEEYGLNQAQLHY
jgi:hypothetical protein